MSWKIFDFRLVLITGTPTRLLIRDNHSLRSTVPNNDNGIAGSSEFIQTASGSSHAPDVGLGKIFILTATGNFTVNAQTNALDGDEITIIIIQDATGGRTVTWNSVFKQEWSDTGNTANLRSAIRFIFDGTDWNQIAKQTGYY